MTSSEYQEAYEALGRARIKAQESYNELEWGAAVRQWALFLQKSKESLQ